MQQTTTARRADSEDQEDDDGKAQDAQELIDQINESKDQTTGRIEDSFIIRFFKDKLTSMPCQNQGFIIDGFPKTVENARELFACKINIFMSIETAKLCPVRRSSQVAYRHLMYIVV